MLLVLVLGCGQGVICNVESVSPTVQLWTDAARSVSEARTVTVQVDPTAGQGVTRVSVLGVALVQADNVWSGSLSADRLEAAARALAPDADEVTLPLDVEVCDVCGCADVPDAGSLEIDLSGWAPSAAPTVTFVTPDAIPWIAAGSTTPTLLEVSAGDVAAAGESVLLTITGGTFLGGAVEQTLTLEESDDDAKAAALFLTESAGTVRVVASLGSATSESSIRAVATPTVTGPSDPLAAGSSAVVAAVSDGGGLAGCTWLTSDHASVEVSFEGLPVEDSVSFPSGPGSAMLVVHAFAAPAELTIQCTDLYGRPASTTVSVEG